MSESVGDYRVVTDFTTSGGGQCRWAFASRDGEEYFLKEFLAPTYPLPDAPGSAATKERKLRKCEKFEEHHLAVTKALAPLSKSGGNLVTTLDFFRAGAKYYKVTEKIDASSLSPEEIAAQPVERGLLILLTVTHSLEILHRAGLVHGDLKPENILIKSTTKGHHTAKLIDFDNAFFSGEPVLPEDMVGDPNYYSPEIFGYLNERVEGRELTTASDIFALGLVAVQFLTGSRAVFVPVEGAGRYPGELCAAGASCTTGLEETAAKADALLRWMLSGDPVTRPTALQVFDALKELRSEARRVGGWPGTSGTVTAEKPKLRGSLLRKTAPAADGTRSDAPPAPAETGSRLRGSLLRKRDSPPT